jgi:NitT/TauT family transport system permease protein
MTAIGASSADAAAELEQADISDDIRPSGGRTFDIRRIAMPVASGVGGIVAVVLIWWAVAAGFHVSTVVLPSPVDVVKAMGSNSSELTANVWPTALEAGLGYLLAIIVGVPLGWFLSRPGRIQAMLNASVISAQVFPKIAVAPLFVLWFGFGYLPKVLFVILLCFFPIVLNSTAGFAGTAQEIRDLAAVLKLSPMSRLWKVEIPAALPNIFAGLKISGTFAVIAAIVMEFVGSNSGLGYFILQTESTLQVPLMFGAFIAITVVGFVLYGLISLAEALAIPWHISRRRASASR